MINLVEGIVDIDIHKPIMSERVTSYFLTLLRHGESEGNASGIWQGRLDFPLTNSGRKQATELARRWRETHVQYDAVISSPLARAYETAWIIASALELNVERDPVWMERDNGLLAGVSRDEIAGTPLTGHIFEPIGSSGESEHDLFLRAGAALHKLMDRPPGKYLIVSHGGILNRVMCVALGIAPQPNQGGARFAFGNTGFARLEFRPHQSLWLVHTINDQAHLNGTSHLPVWQG